MSEPFVFGRTADGREVTFRPAMGNRHGLVTGATGTGKTVTLQVLTDHFSRIGVPVFLADVKGDLSGLARAGALTPKLAERLKATGLGEPAWFSGTSSARAASRSARPSRTWDRCCSGDCST
jgi:DNA helicase HerA-like ATPase